MFTTTFVTLATGAQRKVISVSAIYEKRAMLAREVISPGVSGTVLKYFAK